MTQPSDELGSEMLPAIHSAALSAVDILETVADAIVAIDAEWRVIYVNQGAARLLNRSREELLGRPAWTLTPQEGTALARACRRVMRTGASLPFHDNCVLPDLPLEGNVYASSGGIIIQAHAIGNELSAEAGSRVVELERQLAECTSQLANAIAGRDAVRDQLREANRELELILNSITDNFFGFSQDWRFRFLNAHAAEQMKALGKNLGHLIGKVLWDEFDVPSEEALRRVMSERVTMTHEVYYPPLGAWFENHMYPSPDGGVIMLQKDITERKKAEEKLQRCSNYLADAERLSHVASWAVNVTTGEIFWSDEHFRICGVEPEHFTVTRESTRELIHPDDRDLANDVFERAFRDQHAFQWDFRFLRPDGTIRFAHSLGHPVFNDDGTFTEIVGTVVDITEARLAEQERTQLVRRAMAAQEVERRRIAREMHDQLGERLSAMAITIALLRAECHDQALAAHVDSLEVVTQRLDADVSFLVWELRPIALDDLGLAVALTTHVKSWARHHGLEAQVRVSGLDKDRLTEESETTLFRIMQEALTNIAKHATASHVSVILEHRRDHIFLMVEDDGVGFDVARALRDTGSTWGLVGMRERAELVGGSLEIESLSGSGVTVVVRIPLPVPSESEARRA
jgi:PAS domain S-box-containing protein